MLYYSKAVVSAIMTIFQLVWNIVNVYYQNCWTARNYHIGLFTTFVFLAVVPPDLYMGTVRDIVFIIVEIYHYRELYCRAALVSCFALFLLDIVVFLKVRAESDIGQQVKKLELDLFELIAWTEERKTEKQAADRYANTLNDDHKKLLESYYELNSQFVEMKDRAILAEGRLAEAEAHYQKTEDLKSEVDDAEEAMEASKQKTWYWRKYAMNADKLWRDWSRKGATARLEAGDLRAKVVKLEAEVERLKIEPTKLQARIDKLRAEACRRTALVEKLKVVASGAEDDFVKQYVDQYEEIDRLKRDLAFVTNELDRADEHIIKLTTELTTELNNMTKERDDTMDDLAEMAVERFFLMKEMDSLREERDDLEEALLGGLSDGDWDGNVGGGGDDAAGGSVRGGGSNGQDEDGEEKEDEL